MAHTDIPKPRTLHNDANLENSNDPEKISSSKYYDIEEMDNIEVNHCPHSI